MTREEIEEKMAVLLGFMTECHRTIREGEQAARKLAEYRKEFEALAQLYASKLAPDVRFTTISREKGGWARGQD